MRVSPIDVLHFAAQVVALRVVVVVVGSRCNVASVFTVCVAWENLGECVAHLELAIESPIESRLHRVK